MRKGYLRYAAAIVGQTLPRTVASFAFGSSHLVLNRQMTGGVRPVIARYRNGCPGGNNPAAQFDAKARRTPAPVLRGFRRRELMPATHRHKYSTQQIDFAAYFESRGAL
jgi:hypothetical protein